MNCSAAYLKLPVLTALLIDLKKDQTLATIDRSWNLRREVDTILKELEHIVGPNILVTFRIPKDWPDTKVVSRGKVPNLIVRRTKNLDQFIKQILPKIEEMLGMRGIDLVRIKENHKDGDFTILNPSFFTYRLETLLQ